MRKFTTAGAFSSERRLFYLLEPTSELFLIRENIVDQAVSLSRGAQTGFSHSVPAIRSQEGPWQFVYAPAQIGDKLNRVLRMEHQCEKILAARNLHPLRLSYELLIAKNPEEFVPLIGRHVGAKPENTGAKPSCHGRRFCVSSDDLQNPQSGDRSRSPYKLPDMMEESAKRNHRPAKINRSRTQRIVRIYSHRIIHQLQQRQVIVRITVKPRALQANIAIVQPFV